MPKKLSYFNKSIYLSKNEELKAQNLSLRYCFKALSISSLLMFDMRQRGWIHKEPKKPHNEHFLFTRLLLIFR